jgi:catechol 2,3-dioxygenase-like lactoylglutathione lyase family enzyme
MIRGLTIATIWSEDLTKKLLPFYRDIIGLHVGITEDRFVLFGDPGSPALAIGSHSDVHGVSKEPARHTIGFDVDDLAAEYARLAAAGVEFIEKPTRGDDGPAVATLRDPEGNLVQLLQFE